MSAIAGIYSLNNRPPNRQDLERMSKSMAHRGPNASGLWSDGPVGFVHLMLRTTPESFYEKLPLINLTGNLALTADARIDNRDELIAALDIEATSREEISDSELILAAYEKWGERCPEKLLGDFAFAIWDKRRQEVFCARDHFGVKQLYYYYSDKIFVFATELKAILCLPEVPRRLNEVRLADHLTRMFEDKEATLYEGIFRLPPAHSKSISRDKTKMRCYWTLDASRDIRLGSDAEYAEAYLDVFTKSVQCRLRSADQVGSMLSGGLDSSSITCVARDILAREANAPLQTFSAVYDELPQCDERVYINTVLAQGGVQPHYGHPDRLNPLMDWEAASPYEDEPLWNPQMALHWVVYEAAGKQKVRALLDGFGGDFVISHGFAYLNELARGGHWIRFLSEATDLARHSNQPLKKIVWKRGIIPLIPEPSLRLWRALHNRNNVRWFSGAPINPSFAQAVQVAKRAAKFKGERSFIARSAKQDHWLALSSGFHPFVLGTADRTAAVFQLEGRYPFLDRRLIEFCLGLPPEQKLHRGWTRIIARRALANILPKEIQWRLDKADHSPNLTCGLAKADRRIVKDVIFNSSMGIAKYLDMVGLHQIYEKFLTNPNKIDAFILWRVAALELWLRRTRFNRTSMREEAANYLEVMSDNSAPYEVGFLA